MTDRCAQEHHLQRSNGATVLTVRCALPQGHEPAERHEATVQR